MTVMYLSLRYLGIVFSVLDMLGSVPTIPLSDSECWIRYVICNWTCVVIYPMLWVINITRLNAIYQGSRKILIFLIVTFLAVNIYNAAVAVMTTMHTLVEESIISGTYQCTIGYREDITLLVSVCWILSTAWEILALCLVVWIAVQHFRELRQQSAAGMIRNCFTVLIKTHVLYFASFVAVSCFSLVIDSSPTLSAENSLGSQICDGFLQLLQVVQSFVLGPRLILGVREYHAKHVADSDAATGMATMAFQEHIHISTGSGV